MEFGAYSTMLAPIDWPPSAKDELTVPWMSLNVPIMDGLSILRDLVLVFLRWIILRKAVKSAVAVKPVSKHTLPKLRRV